MSKKPRKNKTCVTTGSCRSISTKLPDKSSYPRGYATKVITYNLKGV